VFVHGLGDFAAGYIPVALLLAEHFRCIAYDLPTGGADGAQLARITHTDLVNDLFSLLDHLGVRQSYLPACRLAPRLYWPPWPPIPSVCRAASWWPVRPASAQRRRDAAGLPGSALTWTPEVSAVS